MITRKECDAFILDVMHRAFLALRESSQASEEQTTLYELQQAMQMLPPPITSDTPLSALQAFLQYGTANAIRQGRWMPDEHKLDALWRNLATLTEGDLQLVASGGSLINFACLQEVERRRVEREAKRLSDAQRKFPPATPPGLNPSSHIAHGYGAEPATLRVRTDYGTMDLCPACAAALVAAGHVPDPLNMTEPTGAVCQCEHEQHTNVTI